MMAGPSRRVAVGIDQIHRIVQHEGKEIDASLLTNRIPADPVYLTDRLGFRVASTMLAELTSSESTLLCLYSDSTLREQVASTELASCVQAASKMRAGNGKTSFPNNWACDAEMLKLAAGFNLNGAAEFAAFKDHALANDRRCKDWTAAYRNWVRKAKTLRETRQNGRKSY